MAYIDPAAWNITTDSILNSTGQLIQSGNMTFMQVPTDSIVFWPPYLFAGYQLLLALVVLALGMYFGYRIHEKRMGK